MNRLAWVAIVAALAAAGWFFVQRPAEVPQQARTPTKSAPGPEKVAEALKPPPAKPVEVRKPAAKKPAPERTAEEERIRLQATQAAERAAAEMAAERARAASELQRAAAERATSASAVHGRSSDALFEQAAALEHEGQGAEAVKLYVRAARAGSAKAAKRL